MIHEKIFKQYSFLVSAMMLGIWTFLINKVGFMPTAIAFFCFGLRIALDYAF